MEGQGEINAWGDIRLNFRPQQLYLCSHTTTTSTPRQPPPHHLPPSVYHLQASPSRHAWVVNLCGSCVVVPHSPSYVFINCRGAQTSHPASHEANTASLSETKQGDGNTRGHSHDALPNQHTKPKSWGQNERLWGKKRCGWQWITKDLGPRRIWRKYFEVTAVTAVALWRGRILFTNMHYNQFFSYLMHPTIHTCNIFPHTLLQLPHFIP